MIQTSPPSWGDRDVSIAELVAVFRERCKALQAQRQAELSPPPAADDAYDREMRDLFAPLAED